MISKVRAWSTDHQVMLDVYNIFWFPDSRIFIKAETIIDGKHIDIQNFIGDKLTLMQSTGLKDKNGVEIFEGNIVRLVEESGDVAVSKVYFSEGAFGMDIEGMFIAFSTLKTMAQAGYTLEVIGNIHENPELLEASCKP